MEGYIQVGVTALRDPVTREYLPAVPLYVKADESTEAEQMQLCQDIGQLLAHRMRDYAEKCREAGVAI